jgi:hypothetical protein
MGNPNAGNLEESATVSATPAVPTEEDGLSVIKVTLGLALPDHTWIEKTVEFEVDPEFEQREDFSLAHTAFEHWIEEKEDEANSLTPSGWFLINWEWKE